MIDVTIGSVRFSDFGICLVDVPDIVSAEQEVTYHDGIDSRDGALTEYGALKDRSVTLSCNLLGEVSSEMTIRRFRGSLLVQRGVRLIFSHEPDIYYLVKSAKLGEVSREIREHGVFEVELVLDPYDYAGAVRHGPGARLTFYNSGTAVALPILRVVGSGDVVIKTNGGYAVNIKALAGKAVIDSKMMDYYDPDRPQLRVLDVACREFPRLKVGENRVEVTGNATVEVEFERRYR